MAVGLRGFTYMASAALLLTLGARISDAIKCYQCVWIKGRTDDDCFYMPQNKRQNLEQDCNKLATPNEGDETLDFQSCETAIACIDRGFGKRPSLHRACSTENPGTKTIEMPSTSDGSITDATTTTQASSSVASKRRRKRQGSPSSEDSSGNGNGENNSTLDADATERRFLGQTMKVSASCQKYGDGETAEGSAITNLTVCACEGDLCNVHRDTTRLKNQIAYATDVCNAGWLIRITIQLLTVPIIMSMVM